jgi:hypothetical protein
MIFGTFFTVHFGPVTGPAVLLYSQRITCEVQYVKYAAIAECGPLVKLGALLNPNVVVQLTYLGHSLFRGIGEETMWTRGWGALKLVSRTPYTFTWSSLCTAQNRTKGFNIVEFPCFILREKY